MLGVLVVGAGGLRPKVHSVKIPLLLLSMITLLWSAGDVRGQALKFSNQRKIEIPEYATLHIGPFYSTITFYQTAGFRYSRSSSSNTIFQVDTQRGAIQKDGLEFPLISRLQFRNYLLLTANADIDFSLSMSYAHYPMETQENDFNIHMVEEGVFGILSTTIDLTPFVKMTVYDNFVAKTDYVDTRGIVDEHGGSSYEHWNNKAGMQLDWRMTKRQNIGAFGSIVDVMPLESGFEYHQRTTYQEGMSYAYAVFPGIHIGARMTFTQTGYADPGRQDTLQQTYSLFTNLGRSEDSAVRVALGKRTTASLRLGYAFAYGYGYNWEDSLTDLSEGSGGEGDVESIVGSVEIGTQLRDDLVHSVKVSRGIQGGFNTGFEIHDIYKYSIRWEGDVALMGLFSSLSAVQPNSTAISSYSNWETGANMKYPLASFIDLLLSSTYTVRFNDAVGLDLDEEEWRDNYATWSSQIGTSFSVTRSVDFSVSYRHTERYSDSTRLEYDRDIVTALFSYKHEF